MVTTMIEVVFLEDVSVVGADSALGVVVGVTTTLGVVECATDSDFDDVFEITDAFLLVLVFFFPSVPSTHKIPTARWGNNLIV